MTEVEGVIDGNGSAVGSISGCAIHAAARCVLHAQQKPVSLPQSGMTGGFPALPHSVRPFLNSSSSGGK